jgi:hypothetical protein
MPKFTKNVTLDAVDKIWRPGIGDVYKGRISVADLAEGLISGDIKYAPKYQRGQKQSDDNDFDSRTLLDITNDKLAIERKRAEAMAAKYLLGFHDDAHREFYNPDIIWNARRGESTKDPLYDPKGRTLTIHSTLTIPDSAHRHYCYYLLYKWHQDPESVPDEVVIAEDGQTVDGGDLQEWAAEFDPNNEEKASTFVTIFNVPADHEGRLFDEYNVEGKKPSAGAAIDMYSDKTASRRFVDALMKKCPIFDRSEIEMRGSTIGAASRKITTVATLDVAIKPFQKKLLELEKTNKGVYADLIEFFTAFYTEWANHYKEFQPTASGKARQDLRKKSFAMSNIMFFPMFRMAFELWQKYTTNGTDWNSEQEWRDGLAKLAGKITVKEGKKTFTVPLMARDSDESVGNPDWQGLILLQKFDSQGYPQGWSLSSTRQTRDAAYHYLVRNSGVSLPAKLKK